MDQKACESADRLGETTLECGCAREMPQYRSHKKVWALKIKELRDMTPEGAETDGSLLMVPEEVGYAPVRLDWAFVRRHNPQVGGYYVVYADGYKSWSPAEAFESGYMRI